MALDRKESSEYLFTRENMANRRNMDSIQFLWQRIETWMKIHAPHAWHMLLPGVSETDIHQTEITLGITFPEDFKASYRLHNGGYTIRLVSVMQILPLEKIISDWQTYKEIKEEGIWDDLLPYYFTEKVIQSGWQIGPIQQTWWDLHWIPFGGDSAGNSCCLDLDPAPGGSVGQIIDWDHEAGPSRVVASGFLEVLSTFADDLEAGKYGDTPTGLAYLLRP
jgi:cell wall assembly regulator SMI1